ncbi:MAG: hypothetical protein ACRC20_00325 [Segniliparus sp.]|uniref:hypothetical protein n=1 Tax=Segniliparus sp. TaxID=2804064 RepID=UPI003F2E9779
MVGRTGVLTIATRGTDGPGEALLDVRGGREAYLAWSDAPLPIGTTVLVIDERGPLAVHVEQWDIL